MNHTSLGIAITLGMAAILILGSKFRVVQAYALVMEIPAGPKLLSISTCETVKLAALLENLR
jgi:hypothetical protein